MRPTGEGSSQRPRESRRGWPAIGDAVGRPGSEGSETESRQEARKAKRGGLARTTWRCDEEHGGIISRTQGGEH